MPLGAGGEGYPDWQRVANMDGPLLWNQTGAKGAGTFGPFNVSRYLSVQLLVAITAVKEQTGLVRLEWFADEAATILLAERQFFTRWGIPEPLAPLIRNLGPWLKVTVESTSLNNVSRAYASNRLGPAEFPLVKPTLLEASKAWGGAGEEVQNPAYYWGGPVRALVFAGTALAFMDVQAQKAASEYETVDRLVAAGGSLVISDMVIPAGGFRVVIHAEGAGGTAKYVLTPFATGSS